MTPAMRDAIIRIKLELAKGKIDASELSNLVKEYENVAKAAQEAAKAQRAVGSAAKDMGGGGGKSPAAPIVDAAKATDAWAAGLKRVNEEWKKGGGGRDAWGEGMERMQKAREVAAASEAKAFEETKRAREELSRATERTNRQMESAFREGGEGALRMARGLALLSSSGSDSLQELVRNVAVAQGAFDVFAGGAKMVGQLGTAFGPAGTAVAALTFAVTAGAAVWNEYVAAINRATMAARAKREEARLLTEQEQRLKEQIVGINAAYLQGSTGAALRESEKRRRQNIELWDIESRGDMVDRQTPGLERDWRRARMFRKEYEGSAEILPSNKTQAFLRGYSATQAGEALAQREEYLYQAEQARKEEQSLMDRELALFKQRSHDLQRADQIKREQNTQLASQADAQFDAFKVASGSALGFGQLANAGFAVGVQQQGLRRDEYIKQLEDDLRRIAAAIRDFAQRTAELEKFREQVNGAHPN